MKKRASSSSGGLSYNPLPDAYGHADGRVHLPDQRPAEGATADEVNNGGKTSKRVRVGGVISIVFSSA
jgi:hypothetical protein